MSEQQLTPLSPETLYCGDVEISSGVAPFADEPGGYPCVLLDFILNTGEAGPKIALICDEDAMISVAAGISRAVSGAIRKASEMTP